GDEEEKHLRDMMEIVIKLFMTGDWDAFHEMADPDVKFQVDVGDKHIHRHGREEVVEELIRLLEHWRVRNIRIHDIKLIGDKLVVEGRWETSYGDKSHDEDVELIVIVVDGKIKKVRIIIR
uniref:DENOVO NTF2 n=1 Tax=synthetic construct TaxID=32630 RepID=UPI00142F3C7C|nr:Chain A, DENOVO NTF2 [synthetic construct]6W40_B Chain B, DENOVO NTF2 [synthetic construct]